MIISARQIELGGYNLMKKPLLFLVSLAMFFSLFPYINANAVQAEPIVMVKLKNYLGNQTEISLKPTGDYETSDNNVVLKANNTYLLKQENGKLSIYKDGVLLNSYTSFSAKALDPLSLLSINNRLYLGSFDFVIENNQFVRPINSVHMEDYLKGVVPIEMYPSWNIEALKTQAIAARTYAMSCMNKTIDDTISYQVYGGYVWTPNSTAAVDGTAGQVLQYNGRLISAVYSASNGGMTQSNSNVWGTTNVPYLPIKQDPYDPATRWSFSFNQTQIDVTGYDLSKYADWWTAAKEMDTAFTNNIKAWLNNNGYANKEIKITSIPVFALTGVDSGGRVTQGSITVNFLVKDLVDGDGSLIPQQISFPNTSASNIRSIIGNRTMLSYLVDSVTTSTDNKVTVTVQGRGDGHGVGMSQWGAKNMADAGKKADEILLFYYSGANIASMYATTPKTAIPVLVAVTPKPTTPKDVKAPVISNVVSSYNNSVKKTSITYTINEGANVTVFVKNSKGTIIKYLQKEVKTTAGKHTVIWDVAPVGNGAYTVGIQATDFSNNKSSFLKALTLNKIPLGTINTTNVLIKKTASGNSATVGKIAKNQKVLVLKKSVTWYYVQYGTKKGYVYYKYISNIK